MSRSVWGDDPGDHPDNELREARRAADNLGIRLEPVEMRGSGDLEIAFTTVTAAHCYAPYVVSSRHTTLNTPTIVNFESACAIPARLSAPSRRSHASRTAA